MAGKHTPGWTYVEGERLSHDAIGFEVWLVRPAIVETESGEAIIEDAEDMEPCDCLLIAAAPDLLEMAFALVNSPLTNTNALIEARKLARAAILKATGGAE